VCHPSKEGRKSKKPASPKKARSQNARVTDIFVGNNKPLSRLEIGLILEFAAGGPEYTSAPPQISISFALSLSLASAYC